MQMDKLRFDNSSDIWFVEGHRTLEARKRFNEAFGSDELSYLLFTSETTPFTPENFRLIGELARAFEESVPYVKRVIWLGNAERISGRGNEVHIEAFFSPPPATAAEIERKLNEALAEPSFAGDLISPDKTALPMIIEFDNYPPKEEDLSPQQTVVDAIDAVLARPRFAPLKPYVSGAPHFNIDYSLLVKRDMSKLSGLVVVVQMILLFFFARDLRGVVVPLAITITAVCWTLGTIGLLGITLNLLSTALPTILICVCIGDAMHGIAAFYREMRQGVSRTEALGRAFAEVGMALLLTSFTTAIGFLAYLSCDVVPYREMGVYVAIGVVYAVVLTFVLTPVFYSFGNEEPVRKKEVKTEALFSRWLQFCHRQVVLRPKTIVFCFSAVMLINS